MLFYRRVWLYFFFFKFLCLNNKLSKYRIHSNSITKLRELECKLDVLNGILNLLTRYPEYSYELMSLASIRFRSIRKFNFETMIKASLGIRPWDIKTLFIYIVYLVTFKKIKL